MDNWEDDGRVLPFEATTFDGLQMTVERCKKLCFEDNDYAYAGVENAHQCFCGNDRPVDPAPQSDCNMACTGNSTQMCGALFRLNVYQKKGTSVFSMHQ